MTRLCLWTENGIQCTLQAAKYSKYCKVKHPPQTRGKKSAKKSVKKAAKKR